MNIRINGGALAATGTLFLVDPALMGAKAINNKVCRHYEAKFGKARDLRDAMLAEHDDAAYDLPEFKKVSQKVADAWKASRRADTIHSWVEGALNAAGFSFGVAAFAAVVSPSVAMFPHVLAAAGAGAVLYTIARAIGVAGVKAINWAKAKTTKQVESDVEQALKDKAPSTWSKARANKYVRKTISLLRGFWEKISYVLETVGFGYVARVIRTSAVLPAVTGKMNVTTAFAVSGSSLAWMPTAAITAVVASIDYMQNAGMVMPIGNLQTLLTITTGLTLIVITGMLARDIYVKLWKPAADKVRKEREQIVAEEREHKATLDAEEQTITTTLAEAEQLLATAKANLRYTTSKRKEIDETLELVKQKEAASANLLKQITAEYKEASDRNEEAAKVLAKAEEESRKMHARDKTGPTPKRAPRKAAVKKAAPAKKAAPNGHDPVYAMKVKNATGVDAEALAALQANADAKSA